MAPLTLYFDRNMGRSLPAALAELRLNVVHHHMPKSKLGMSNRSRTEPLFAPDVPDDEWLEFVGIQGWTAFSHDAKFHLPGYEIELAAIKQHNVGCFYVWGASALRWQKARCFLRAYDKVIAAINSTPRPFIYSINRHGNLTAIKLP